MSLFVVVFFLCESLLYIFCDKWYYEIFIFYLTVLTKSLILLITKRFMIKTVEAEAIA